MQLHNFTNRFQETQELVEHELAGIPRAQRKGPCLSYFCFKDGALVDALIWSKLFLEKHPPHPL